MSDYQMGVIEAQFADIIWEKEPVSSTELCRLGDEAFKWKKSTTYTVLKRLCEKGLFKNEKGVVCSVINRDEFYSLQSKQFVQNAFDGSLPAFLAAFTAGKRLTDEEVAQLKQIVAEYEEV